MERNVIWISFPSLKIESIQLYYYVFSSFNIVLFFPFLHAPPPSSPLIPYFFFFPLFSLFPSFLVSPFSLSLSFYFPLFPFFIFSFFSWILFPGLNSLLWESKIILPQNFVICRFPARKRVSCHKVFEWDTSKPQASQHKRSLIYAICK